MNIQVDIETPTVTGNSDEAFENRYGAIAGRTPDPADKPMAPEMSAEDNADGSATGTVGTQNAGEAAIEIDPEHTGEDVGGAADLDHEPPPSEETGAVAADEVELAMRAAFQAERSARGARAHYLGETVGRYVCRFIGAQPAKPYSNDCTLADLIFKIRTINGSQSTFTVNLDTEPEAIIVAARKLDKALVGASRYVLYGVYREDAFARAKKSSSKGHIKSGHQQVSLTQVPKVELGSIVISDELVRAETSDQRRLLVERIYGLAANIEDPTAMSARAFLGV